MFTNNPQRVSLKILNVQKMAKRALGIAQNGSKLNSTQNLIAFWGPFLVIKPVLEQISLHKLKDRHQKTIKRVLIHVLFLKLAKRTHRIEQCCSKLDNIQNLTPFWAISM